MRGRCVEQEANTHPQGIIRPRRGRRDLREGRFARFFEVYFKEVQAKRNPPSAHNAEGRLFVCVGSGNRPPLETS